MVWSNRLIKDAMRKSVINFRTVLLIYTGVPEPGDYILIILIAITHSFYNLHALIVIPSWEASGKLSVSLYKVCNLILADFLGGSSPHIASRRFAILALAGRGAAPTNIHWEVHFVCESPSFWVNLWPLERLVFRFWAPWTHARRVHSGHWNTHAAARTAYMSFFWIAYIARWILLSGSIDFRPDWVCLGGVLGGWIW